MRLCAFIIAGVLLLCGCAGFARIAEPPAVTLADIQVVEMGLLEQQLVLKLRVQNPNDADFEVDGLAYTLELNGKPFARGVGNKATRVPRYGVAMIETEAVSGLGGVLRQVDLYRKGDRSGVSYRLSGHLSAGTIGRIPFDYKGELAIPAFEAPTGK